ncbi:MAG: helix-turn-helix domain-containing protein [Sphingomicrobium sp.]
MTAMKYEVARPYVMKARAEAAAATKARILESARALLVTYSFEEMTIDAIAAGAHTTVRTVIRVFGSKEELFAQALHSLGEFGIRPIVSKDVDALLAGAYDFYEKIGDTVIRWLGDEARLAPMHKHLEIGRKHLRSWVSKAFDERLSACDDAARKELLNGLIVAFDVYTWKLLRRDFRLSRRAAQATTKRMIVGLLGRSSNG